MHSFNIIQKSETQRLYTYLADADVKTYVQLNNSFQCLHVKDNHEKKEHIKLINAWN